MTRRGMGVGGWIKRDDGVGDSLKLSMTYSNIHSNLYDIRSNCSYQRWNVFRF